MPLSLFTITTTAQPADTPLPSGGSRCLVTRQQRARCNLMTAKLLAKRLKSSTKTSCFGLQFGAYCIAIWCLSETKTSCFGRWQLNGCRPLSRKGGTGYIQIMFFAASCAGTANKKKGSRKFGYSAGSPYFCGRKL